MFNNGEFVKEFHGVDEIVQYFNGNLSMAVIYRMLRGKICVKYLNITFKYKDSID